jgi:predicted CDP-diglyceride synthetase/phosphatidate cytidylyltransferase
MADFLQSSVLPGENIPKHEHRRMLIVLLVIVLVAIVACLVYIFGSKQSTMEIVPVVSTPNKTREQLIAEDLKKSVVQISEEEKMSIAEDLRNSVVKLTEKQKADIAAELMKSVKKQ